MASVRHPRWWFDKMPLSCFPNTRTLRKAYMIIFEMARLKVHLSLTFLFWVSAVLFVGLEFLRLQLYRAGSC